MLTIREQILKVIKTELAKILTANGYYTNVGLNTVRGRYDLMPIELPSLVMIANQEEATPQLGHETFSTELTVSGFTKFATAITDYSDRLAHDAEAVLGDIKTCLLSYRVSMPFSLGAIEPEIGATLTGVSSGATSILESITLSSGSWSGGDAAGTLSVRLPHLDYTNEQITNPKGGVVATVSGTMTAITLFSDLLNNIEYLRGGIDPLPDIGESIMKISATFSLQYVTLAGNPYKQS